MNGDYRRYLSGDLLLKMDEIHQVGFRVAKECGHEQLHSVDWNRPVGDVALGHVYDFAEEVQPDLYKQIKADGDQLAGEGQQFMDTHCLREVFLNLNDSERVKQEQKYYMKLARVSEGEYYIGIDWLANYWYRRNMIIFTNITRLGTSPQERILVLYGAGHKYLLDQFARESGLYHLESVETYLGERTNVT